MNTTQNKALVERLFSEGMNKRNLSAIDEIIAPQFVNHSMPMPAPGPDGFKAILEQFTHAFPDMQINLERVVAENDLVVTQGHWTGTNKGSFMGMPVTGRKVNIGFMDFWRIEGGKAVENWVQMDHLGIMQQLGLMQQPA